MNEFSISTQPSEPRPIGDILARIDDVIGDEGDPVREKEVRTRDLDDEAADLRHRIGELIVEVQCDEVPHGRERLELLKQNLLEVQADLLDQTGSTGANMIG